MNKNDLLVTVVLVCAGAREASACDLCSVYSACEAQGGGGGFYAGGAAQFTEFGTLQTDGNKVSGNGEYLHSFVSQMFAGWNVNERFGVQVNVPYIDRAYGSDSMRGSVSGLGDVSLTANVRLWQKSAGDWTFAWTAMGGVKLPTGAAGRLNTPDGELPDGIGGHDIALGSGSVDGLAGSGFSARWKRVFVDGQMQYGIRTEGKFQHRYANDWTWAGGPGWYLVLKDNHTVALQAAVSGESKGKDTFAGVEDGDSAATVVYAGPKVSFTWSERFSGHIGADLPLSMENSGTQLLPDWRVHAAVTWKF